MYEYRQPDDKIINYYNQDKACLLFFIKVMETELDKLKKSSKHCFNFPSRLPDKLFRFKASYIKPGMALYSQTCIGLSGKSDLEETTSFIDIVYKTELISVTEIEVSFISFKKIVCHNTQYVFSCCDPDLYF